MIADTASEGSAVRARKLQMFTQLAGANCLSQAGCGAESSCGADGVELSGTNKMRLELEKEVKINVESHSVYTYIIDTHILPSG